MILKPEMKKMFSLTQNLHTRSCLSRTDMCFPWKGPEIVINIDPDLFSEGRANCGSPIISRVNYGYSRKTINLNRDVTFESTATRLDRFVIYVNLCQEFMKFISLTERIKIFLTCLSWFYDPRGLLPVGRRVLWVKPGPIVARLF